jgi:hypothetical protein
MMLVQVLPEKLEFEKMVLLVQMLPEKLEFEKMVLLVFASIHNLEHCSYYPNWILHFVADMNWQMYCLSIHYYYYWHFDHSIQMIQM